jgi:hypothetical protein
MRKPLYERDWDFRPTLDALQRFERRTGVGIHAVLRNQLAGGPDLQAALFGTIDRQLAYAYEVGLSERERDQEGYAQFCARWESEAGSLRAFLRDVGKVGTAAYLVFVSELCVFEPGELADDDDEKKTAAGTGPGTSSKSPPAACSSRTSGDLPGASSFDATRDGATSAP